MIFVIEHDCVEQKKWISHDEMMNVTVIAVILVFSMFGYRHVAKRKLSPIMRILISAVAGIVVYGI